MLEDITNIKAIADGKYLVCSGSWKVDGLVRLNNNGSIDYTFNAYQEKFGLYSGALGILPDDNYLAAIHYTDENGYTVAKLVRLKSDGKIDNAFLSGICNPNSYINDIEVLSDGKILVAGIFSKYNNQSVSDLIRLNPDGSIDLTFSPSAKIKEIIEMQIADILINKNGKIILTGGSHSSESNKIIQINEDGSFDYSFNVGTFGLQSAYYMHEPKLIRKDDRVFLIGNHVKHNNKMCFGVTAMDTSGSVIESFSPYLGGNPLINSVYKQVDGKILIGGEFSQIDSFYVNNFARFNKDGSLDTAFARNIAIGTDGTVNSIVGLSDTSIIIGGNFWRVNEIYTGNAAKLYPDGTLDKDFNPLISGSVNRIVIDSLNRIFICGDFNNVSNIPRNGFAVLHDDGKPDNTVNYDPVLS